MKTLNLVLLLFATIALASDFQQAKLVDVQGFKQPGASIIAPNNGFPVVIPTSQNMFTITVALPRSDQGAMFTQSRTDRHIHNEAGVLSVQRLFRK